MSRDEEKVVSVGEFHDLQVAASWRSPSVLLAVTIWTGVVLTTLTAIVLLMSAVLGRAIPAVAWALPGGLLAGVAHLARSIRPEVRRDEVQDRRAPP
jgi:uncharacterized BrkB/YihY/UPF0761 family membrane protein